MPSRERGHFFMAYIRGEAREQTTMFPATLDELIPVDHICRVMEAFVGRLNMATLVCVGAEPGVAGWGGLRQGGAVGVDGSKFRAVSSAKSVREREAMKRYLEQLDTADEQDEVVIDPSAVQAALEKLQNDPEPEARFMRMGSGH